jgi:hypothetical protein
MKSIIIMLLARHYLFYVVLSLSSSILFMDDDNGENLLLFLLVGVGVQHVLQPIVLIVVVVSRFLWSIICTSSLQAKMAQFSLSHVLKLKVLCKN